MPELVTPSTSSATLFARIHDALQESPYVSPVDVEVDADEGHVRLRGHVDTYFKKQMAQEVVRRVDGVERVENLLEVNWR